MGGQAQPGPGGPLAAAAHRDLEEHLVALRYLEREREREREISHDKRAERKHLATIREQRDETDRERANERERARERGQMTLIVISTSTWPRCADIVTKISRCDILVTWRYLVAS